MWIIYINILISLLIPFIMAMASVTINKLYFNSDIFECGFDPFNVSVFPVSLRFLMSCVIFLISDMELVLMSLCPLSLMLNGLLASSHMLIGMLLFGLAVEWSVGSLSWAE